MALTARLGYLGIAAREVAGRRHDEAYHVAYVRRRGGRRRVLVV